MVLQLVLAFVKSAVQDLYIHLKYTSILMPTRQYQLTYAPFFKQCQLTHELLHKKNEEGGTEPTTNSEI